MQPMHDRMPAILNSAHYNSWLNVEHFNRAQLEALLMPYGGLLDAYPVSPYVNSPKHDDAKCVDRADP